jgi:hypothetical protein
MEPKKSKASDQDASDEVIQFFKRARARKMCLAPEFASRMDVMETIANNRAIASLDLHECQV